MVVTQCACMDCDYKSFGLWLSITISMTVEMTVVDICKRLQNIKSTLRNLTLEYISIQNVRILQLWIHTNLVNNGPYSNCVHGCGGFNSLWCLLLLHLVLSPCTSPLQYPGTVSYMLMFCLNLYSNTISLLSCPCLCLSFILRYITTHCVSLTSSHYAWQNQALHHHFMEI